MAGYIPRFGKKRLTLDQHERWFADAIERGTDDATLVALSEQIRAAQLRSAGQALAIDSRQRNTVAMLYLAREMAFCQELPAGAIIAGCRNGTLRGHRSAAARRAAQR